MSFSTGFTKIAGLERGLAAAGKETIKDALKMKGMREAVHDIKGSYKWKVKDLFKTPEGRKDLGYAVGKSLPSAAAGTLYAGAGLKAYKAMKSKNQTAYDQQYY